VIIKRFLCLTFIVALTTVAAHADNFLSVRAKINLNTKGNHGVYIEVAPFLKNYQNAQREQLKGSIVEFMPFLAKPTFYPTQISSNFHLKKDTDNPLGLILTDSLYPKNINEWVNGILADCFNHYWQTLSPVDQAQFEPIFSVQPKWTIDVKSESEKFSNYLEQNYKSCLDVEEWRVGLPDFIHMKMTSYFTSKRNNLPFTQEDLPVAKFFDHIHTAQLGKIGQIISNQRHQSLKQWIDNVKKYALIENQKISIKKSFSSLKSEGKLSLIEFLVFLMRENLNNFNMRENLDNFDDRERKLAVFVDTVASACLTEEKSTEEKSEEPLSPVHWVVSVEKCPFNLDSPKKGYFELIFQLKSGKKFKFILPLIKVQK
jgi:hypothetical protein